MSSSATPSPSSSIDPHRLINNRKRTKLPFQNYWFICDLDGTLVPSPYKKGGAHLPLTHSPCNNAVSAWLRGGGNLAVISTAGTNLFRQILQPLSNSKTSAGFKGSLILCGFSGAVMFRLTKTSWGSQKETNKEMHVMEEVTEYRYYGGPNGTTTCVSNSVCQDVFSTAVEVYRKLFRLFEQDETKIDLLSKRYIGPFKALLEIKKTYRKKGKATQFDQEYLNDKTLTERGKYIDRDPLICFQSVPKMEKHSSSSYTFEEHGSDEDFIIAQISFLGIPAKLFPLLFLSPSSCDVINKTKNPSSVFSNAQSSSLSSFFKEKLGLKVACQPNSVAITKVGVDKGSAIQWMLTHPDGFANISPLRCIAVGDQPLTVDATMMRFSSKFTLPFFSVGKSFLNNPEVLARAPREVRLAIENGGFVDFGELVSAQDERATSVLFMFAMDYLESAATLVQENLLQFAKSRSSSSPSSNIRLMMRASSETGGDRRDAQQKTDEQTTAVKSSSSSSSSSSSPLRHARQLRMPVVERILTDLQMDGDRTSMRRRAMQLVARYESHL